MVDDWMMDRCGLKYISSANIIIDAYLTARIDKDETYRLLEVLRMVLRDEVIDKAIRGYVEGEISLGKAAEVAGMSKRKFMAMIENLGIPFNISAYDLVKGFGVLSELRGQ